MTRGRFTGLACAGLAAVAACAGPPAAAARPMTGAGFAVSAQGFPSYVRLRATPGRTLSATLLVLNRRDRPQTIDVAPAPVSTASLGGVAFGPGHPGTLGWLHVSRHRVRLPAGRTVPVRFTVHVPQGAAPGEHYLGIVATPATVAAKRTGARRRIAVRIITRLAMTVEVRVPGRLRHRMGVGGAGVLSEPAGTFLTLRLSNRGNALVESTAGALEVRSGRRTLLRTKVGLGPFVPGTAISLHVPWTAELRPGRYLVTGRLRPAVGPPVHFRRVLIIGSRTVAAVAARRGPLLVAGPSELQLEVGGGALGALAGMAIAAVFDARRRRRQWVTGTWARSEARRGHPAPGSERPR